MASSAGEVEERTCRLMGDTRVLHSSSNGCYTLGTVASLVRQHTVVVFTVLCFRKRVRGGIPAAACSCIGDRDGSFTCDSLEARRTAFGSRSCSPWFREQPVHFVQTAGTFDYVQVKKACQIHYVKHLSVEARRFAS